MPQLSQSSSQLEYTKSVTWQNVGVGVGAGDGAFVGAVVGVVVVGAGDGVVVGAGDGAFVLFVQHPQPSTPQPSA